MYPSAGINAAAVAAAAAARHPGPPQPGQPFKFTVGDSCDRIKEEFNFLQAQYHNVVDGEVFAGLSRTLYLSLADNEIPSVPRYILSHLSLLRTLDLSRNRITRIEANDFKYNPSVQHLLIAGNSISEMIPGSLPPMIRNLHVGRNHLHTLNKTL
ncbi:hypothetical protein PV327_003617, partial [Microctonus hyperodae]